MIEKGFVKNIANIAIDIGGILLILLLAYIGIIVL